MPLLFRMRCADCGYETLPSMPAVYGAVIVEPPEGEAGFALREPWIELLPHPGEYRALERMGLTFESAAAAGRLLSVRQLVCRTCGETTARAEMATGAGCLPALAFPLVFGACAFALTASAGLAAVGAVLGLIVGLSGPRWLRRRRYRERICALAAEIRCATCGGHDLVELERARGLRCPKCGGQSLDAFTAGIS